MRLLSWIRSLNEMELYSFSPPYSNQYFPSVILQSDSGVDKKFIILLPLLIYHFTQMV